MTQKLTVKIRLDGAPPAAEPSTEPGPINKTRVAGALLVLLAPLVLLWAWWPPCTPSPSVVDKAPSAPPTARVEVGTPEMSSSVAINREATTKAPVPSATEQRRLASAGSPSPTELEVQSAPAQHTMQRTAPAIVTEPIADESVMEEPRPAEAHRGMAARRFALTSAMAGPEPTDSLSAAIPASGDIRRVYFFTEVEAMKGQSLHHRWYFRDELVADVTLVIGSNRWRTHSSKRIAPFMTGHWRVEAVTADERVIARQEFAYGDPGEF